MLYGTTQNYYQPNTSNMYSNPYQTQQYNPYQTTNTTALFNNQAFSPMTSQYSYTNQGFGNYSNFGFQQQPSYMSTQSSTINPMLLSLLQNLISFLPLLTEQNTQTTAATVPTTSTPVTVNNFFQKFMQELIGLNGQKEKDAAQDTKIAAVETKNASQDTAIAANTAKNAAQDTKITAVETKNIAQDSKIATVETKNTAQDTEITSLKTQIAELKTLLSQNTAKDTAQDTKIAAGVTKDAAQDTAIAKLTTPEFLAKNLSTAELSWLKSNNIDLTQVATDGSPTYLVAKGQQDGKYHIYKQYKGAQYKCVVSVPQGNNYLYTTDVASNKNMANIAKSIGGDFVINQGKYTTGSPLILDTNENGTIEAQQGIGVDIDQNGAADGAAVKGDKMLAMKDLNGNGKIDGTEVFGNETINPFTGEKIEATNGFEALKQVAVSAEAKTGITIIEDNKVNVVKLQEALKSIGSNLGLISDSNVTELEALGNVSKISLAYEDKNDDIDYIENNINNSSVSLQNGSYETTEGKTNKVDDVWFKLA